MGRAYRHRFLIQGGASAPPPTYGAPMLRFLTGLCSLLTQFAKVFIGALVGVIVLITLAAVWWRYILNSPLPWPEQVSRIMFVWVTFIGAAILYRERLHVAIDMFVSLLPLHLRIVVGWAVELSVLAFNVILLIYGLRLSLGTLTQTFGALDISPATFYFAGPTAAAMMILFFAERVLSPTGRARIGGPAGSTTAH